MDKRQLIEIMGEVYKSLTPSKVSVFLKNAEIINVRVVSEAFSGMTFSARFKLLNQLLKDQQPEIFNKYIYVFEAFTSADVAHLPESAGDDKGDEMITLKQSARPLES